MTSRRWFGGVWGCLGGRKPGLDGDDAGQAMVEFAFTVPIIVLLFVSVVGFSFLLYFFVTLNSAAREGARYVVGKPYAADAEVVPYVKGKVGILNPDLLTVTISPPPANRAPGNNVLVQVAYPFQIMDVTVPYVIAPGSFTLFPPLVLRAYSTMNLD